MRPWFLVVFTAALIAVPTSATSNATSAKAAVLPSISIVGNHFVDGNGATIRLLGVNRSGSEYMCTGGGANTFDGPSDDTSIAAMAAWHINAVRLGMNEDCWLGINGLPNSMTAAAYQTAIVNYVNLLHNHGLYAILELHWNAPGSSQSLGQQVMVDADHGTAFWTSVANTFKADSNTLFDLYNEPQGISWACLRDGCTAGFATVGMQSLVNTVRGTGATNPILIGGLGYAGDVSQWLAFKPTGTGIAASFHTYDFVGNCNGLSCASTLLGIAAQVPMVTGELGETDCGHSYIDTYMPWADTNGISYLGWAWNTYGCTFPGLINAYDGTPSATFGQGFHDHLAALFGNPAATVTVVAPNTGLPAGGTAVTITGTNFTGASAVQFGGTAAASFSVTNGTQISAMSPAGTGTMDIRVTTAAGMSAIAIADQFTYTGPPPPAPTVTGVAPTSGPAGGGTSVTITGTSFTGATSVKFASATASFSVTDATHIAATSPAGSGMVDVTVVTAGGTSATGSSDQFTYINAPTVTAVAPTGGTTLGGTPVTITGTNFTGATAVKFGATTASYTVTDATHIATTSPAGSAGTVDVKVTTAGGTSATAVADHFTYTSPPPPAPTVTGLAPTSGPATGGTPVTITGTNFTGATSVKFASATATFSVTDATHIAATSPAGSGTVDVTVMTAGGTSATGSSDQFTYINAPTVTALAPTSGTTAGGTPVTITGTNFTGATAVRFGATTAGFSVTDATHIAATSPAGSGIMDVRVTTAGGTSATSSGDQFTYVGPPPPAPTVTGVSPATGPAAGGTGVTITGTNFSGATAVNFGATATTYTVTDATHIAATSPAGAGLVDVTVTTAGGTSATSSADQFTNISAPTVSSVAPTGGPAAGGTAVTITGTNFTGATAVKFGSTTAAFTVTDATHIAATSPAGSGMVDLRVTAPGGTSATSSSDRFTYSAPSLLTYYFQWFDMASPGMMGDNIHLLNLGGSTANVTVSMPGASPINVSLSAGAETHVTFGASHLGGPVVVTSDQPILASQRVQYFQSFNEVWAMTAAQAANVSYIQWFDRASPGMVGDNIHVLNPGNVSANVTISLPGATPISFALGAGAEHYATFPPGHIGGPVTVSADQPVLASSRVQYYQTFNEVVARSAAQATTTSYFNWFDKATGGMVGDNIHVLNTSGSIAHVTLTLAGASPINLTLSAGAEGYVTFPAGHIGGPVTVTSDVAVLASQRVQYFQSFNETPAASAAQAQMTSHVMWFDRASPGMVGDNIHILNPGGTIANITVTLPGSSMLSFSLGAGMETYVSFPVGHIGGPVTITSDQAVLAAQRLQYYQTFNEVPSA